MKHIHHIKTSGHPLPESFVVKATGKYYTHPAVAEQLARSTSARWTRTITPGSTVRIIDPFGGDGRLVVSFIREWVAEKRPDVEWQITLWDLCERGLSEAESALKLLRDESSLDITWELLIGDSFHLADAIFDKFDVVISNPPWELLKPDRRELKLLEAAVSQTYVEEMRQYDELLARLFPAAQPARKFAGWGTNLSRVGLDVCRTLLAPRGVMGVVMPASFMADELSLSLRKDFLQQFAIYEIAYYPAEAKLFGSADISSVTLVAEKNRVNGFQPLLTRYDKELQICSQRSMPLSDEFLQKTGFIVPVSVDGDAIPVLQRLIGQFPTWHDLEGHDSRDLWAGREVDETGSKNWLSESTEGPLFAKGRMIDRFSLREKPSQRIDKKGWSKPSSSNFTRIVWRDVSRPSQKRRVIATLIEPGIVAGNSLGVAYFRNDDQEALKALLGVMSSLIFEFQLRSHLATGHVSLSALRKVRLPSRSQLNALTDIAHEVEKLLRTPSGNEARLEALVAQKAYRISEEEFHAIIDTFTKLTNQERGSMLNEYRLLAAEGAIPRETSRVNPENKKGIPNHFSARLSELDMKMIQAVPEGGNWKDIPDSIPSARLTNIRASFKRGEGSRSTYYGRLKSDMPSYTINTYFNRPGNGCHIHPSQDRVLSQREAARLQSFPDDFHFVGPQGIVNNQIGNAVPPLLAFQIAKQLGAPGAFVDLFCGAGGMGLGFSWAGWEPIVANDIEPRFLETYRLNIHNDVVLGSITDPSIQSAIIKRAQEFRERNPGIPLWILGGPPCQGFSTAGRKRSMDDERNQLFWDYCKVIESLRPDGFVFENVTGLLNMQKGEVFEMVQNAFRAVMPAVKGWVLSADEYAIPQRRKRVFLISTMNPEAAIKPPSQITSCSQNADLFSENARSISVGEAISDLPALRAGQDGSDLNYICPPQSTYQAFMRGQIGPEDFLDSVRDRRTNREELSVSMG